MESKISLGFITKHAQENSYVWCTGPDSSELN